MEEIEFAGKQFMLALHKYLNNAYAVIEKGAAPKQFFADLVTVYRRFYPTTDERQFFARSVAFHDNVLDALNAAEMGFGPEFVDAFRRLLLNTMGSDARGFVLLMCLGDRIRITEEEYAYMVKRATISVEASGALWLAAPTLTQCIMALNHDYPVTNYRKWLPGGQVPTVKRRGRKGALLTAVMRHIATEYPNTDGGAKATTWLLKSGGETIDVSWNGKNEKVRIGSGELGTSKAFISLTPEGGTTKKYSLDYVRKEYFRIRKNMG